MWTKTEFYYCSYSRIEPICIVWAPAVDDGCRLCIHFWRRASESWKTRVAVDFNQFLCYFIDLYKTPTKRSRPTPLE
jgi:hypothetical protein